MFLLTFNRNKQIFLTFFDIYIFNSITTTNKFLTLYLFSLSFPLCSTVWCLQNPWIEGLTPARRIAQLNDRRSSISKLCCPILIPYSEVFNFYFFIPKTGHLSSDFFPLFFPPLPPWNRPKIRVANTYAPREIKWCRIFLKLLVSGDQ